MDYKLLKTTSSNDPNKVIKVSTWLHIISQEEQDKLIVQSSKEISDIILNRVLIEIPELLTYANFMGEAEQYMSSKGIPFNLKIREQYASAIRADFIAGLKDTVSYDVDEKVIKISPYIYSLEYGDFYRPALSFLSICIKQWLKDAQKDAEETIKNSKK